MYHVSIKQQFKGWDTEGIDTECTVVGTSALYPQVILDPQYSHRVCCNICDYSHGARSPAGVLNSNAYANGGTENEAK